jgi:UDP-arabinose 4-epimerase
MTNILVTGGAGYIGSHTCKALSRAGFTPITYDNLVYGHEWAVKWGPLEKGDILDTARLSKVIDAYKPAAAIHFAAFAYVGESVEHPAKYYRNNVVGTLSLLDAMRANGVDKIVFSSTCATYGIPDKLPISEDAPQLPINPYGRSKLMIEQILADYGSAYDLKSVSLRYFNAAGADPEGNLGESHDPETHLIPLVLDAAAGRRPNITAYGDDYDTPDGTCIRDYIHVSDLAEAHVRAMIAMGERKLERAYNLGTGRGYSVKEVIDAGRRLTNRDFVVLKGARRPGDPARLVADASRARHDLGWVPAFADVIDSIGTAWQWDRRDVPHFAGTV